MNWIDRQGQLADLARRQLFFIGGAPRSGTTWLQQMLDAHPEVSCKGEAFLQKQLAEPLEHLMATRMANLTAKNVALFRHTGGYPLPAPEDTEHLLGTGILLALQRQGYGENCRAIGEKTPENVFFFARLKKLFPTAKFVGIARDPRDVLTSAWHFFNKDGAGPDIKAAKEKFISHALPSLNHGAETMIALSREFPADYAMVTFEALLENPAVALGRLFNFLGVSGNEKLTLDCVRRTSFASQTDGGVAGNGIFHRKGVAGDWQSTLTADMNEMILDKLGWMFPHFGWNI